MNSCMNLHPSLQLQKWLWSEKDLKCGSSVIRLSDMLPNSLYINVRFALCPQLWCMVEDYATISA